MSDIRPEEVIAKFKSIAEAPYQRLSHWKKQTQAKIMGCVAMYVPEELIHAAGFLPVTPLGTRERIPLADEHVQTQVCPPVRSYLELPLRGDLDFLDGIVFCDNCDGTKNLSDLWLRLRPVPLHYHFRVPRSFVPPSSGEYLYEEFARLKAFLEKASGKSISSESLQQSIQLYNQHRSLLKDLYELRANSPDLLKRSDVAAIITASKFMPKEEHIELLTPLVRHLKGLASQPDKSVRIILSGPYCWDVPPSVLDLIEELGASIPDDDCYIGHRSFADQVREEGDPLQALAEAYMKGVPCPTKQDLNNDIAAYLIDKARKAKAKGVVTLTAKYCEPHGFTYLWVSNDLSKAGISSLLLELDQEEPSLAQFRVRLEAFIEMIRED